MGTRDVQITEDLLKGILVKGDVTDGLRRIRCIEGLPTDAILRCASLTKRGDLLLTFSSDEWVGVGFLDVMYEEDRSDDDSKDRQIAELQRKVNAIPASLREYIG